MTIAANTHEFVPGEAFDINHPSIKLVNMIGGGFFNEPKYYENDEINFEAFARSIRESGEVHSVTLKSLGLSEQACEVIQTAVDVANSDSPEDLLILAYWARDLKKGLKLRTTPQVLLAIAAAHPNTKQFVRRYTPHITQRADDIPQVFGAFRSLFQAVKTDEGKIRHQGTVPHSLRKGLADAIRQTPAFGLIRYKNSTPSFKDVLTMIGGSKRVKNAVSKGMHDYLVKGEITKDAPQILIARDKFNQLPKTPEGLATLTVEDLRHGGLTWENVIGKFGQSKEAWELLIPTMGEMALTRNLRNFEQQNISEDTWINVATRLAKFSENTSQLPYQYYTAYKNVSVPAAKESLSIALDNACQSIPDLPGVSLLLADNSGSAAQCPISSKSDTKVSDAGNTLMAVMGKRFGSGKAILGVFGDRFRQVHFNNEMSCIEIANQISHYAYDADLSDGYVGHPRLMNPSDRARKLHPGLGKGVGWGTESGLWYALEEMIREKIVVQRIVLLSDLCCYNLGDMNQANFSEDPKFARFVRSGRLRMSTMVDAYLKEVNPDCHIYSVNLNGHSQTQLNPSANVHILSGWSEKIVNTMLQTEAQTEPRAESTTPVVKSKAIPTIEVLREEFKVGV